MLPKKQPSGDQKRKKRKQEEKSLRSQIGSLDKFLVKKQMLLLKIIWNIFLDDDELKSSCLNLEIVLKNGEDSDIDAKDLFMELQILQHMLPSEAYETDKPWTSIKIMEFTKKMDMFPNVMIAYRILLTIPVTVASAERSFSKLKLLKSYLRTTMTQDRLNGLAILSIERDMLGNVNYEQIIDDFSSKNARRNHFR
ncbi:hypothetical protein M0R45_029511 [Rubus argutus]|uniref:HAT C-terminal dimerisation domain-containing protein n=1 Tax=Rubus argutus TaxID=59490 RepID=A0AAW1W8C9_RUBAR